MKAKTLGDLMLMELRDVYDAEHRLVKALPKLAKAASSEELRAAFQKHLEETRGQIGRLDRVFAAMGETPKKKKCEAMVGLVEEGEEMAGLNGDPSVVDAGLIPAAQKAEHYEIASYGCLCTWADRLGLADAAELLRQNLAEEKATDRALSELAEARVNEEAAAPA